MLKAGAAVLASLAVVGLCGIYGAVTVSFPSGTAGAELSDTQTPAAQKTLTRADIVYQKIAAPAPSSQDGTINASDWAESYPYIVATWGDNAKNSYVTSYLEEDPYLVNIYEGYGFAKDYGSARGHEYCLEDVAATQRPHPKANCLTCKTPNFTKLVNDQGVGVYSMAFDDVLAVMLLHLPRQRTGQPGRSDRHPLLCIKGAGRQRRRN